MLADLPSLKERDRRNREKENPESLAADFKVTCTILPS